MSWLALLFVFELGFLPKGYIEPYQVLGVHESIDLAGSGYVDFEIDVTAFDYFFIGGMLKTYINSYKLETTFTPILAEYGFNAGVRFEFIELGFRHYCMHPVVPWLYHNTITPTWEAAYEEIYLRIEVGG